MYNSYLICGRGQKLYYCFLVFIFLSLVFNATFRNITAISWRPVLVVEEAGVPVENHRPATGKLYHLRQRVECTLFVIYKDGREPTPYW